MPLPTAERERVLATIESSDRFLIQQMLRPLVNEYRISVPAPGSTEEGEPLLSVRQKRMKIKEDIRFRLDPERDEHLFMIKSKSVFEFRGRHDVLDDRGEAIGLLEKDFTRSLLRSHWHVRDTSGTELFESYEQSWLIALVRRFADNIGDFAAPLAYLPFNFAIVRDGIVSALIAACSGSCATATSSSSTTRSKASTGDCCSPSQWPWTRCRTARDT